MAIAIHVLVSVSLVPGAVIDPDDANSDGSDSIAGFYGFVLDPSAVQQRASAGGEDNALEAALDLFHDQIGIAELDNYEISAERVNSPGEAPENTSWR